MAEELNLGYDLFDAVIPREVPQRTWQKLMDLACETHPISDVLRLTRSLLVAYKPSVP